MLYFAGIIITFFLVIILLTKKGKSAADLVLACWLCIIGFHLFLFYLHITREIFNHTYLLGTQIPMPLLQGPLLYIYVLTVTRYKVFSKTHLLHFIPFFVAHAFLLKFYLLTSAEKIAVYQNEGAGFETQKIITLVAIILSGFLYVIISFYELRKYKKRIADEFSNTERINLNWLRYLIYGILAIWLAVLINGEDALIFGVVVLFVVLLGYFGIRHTDIFTYRRVLDLQTQNQAVKQLDSAITKEGPVTPAHKQPLVQAPPITQKEIMREKERVAVQVEEPQSKYERSGLQKEAAEKIHRELVGLMQTEKIFKSAELSLTELAHRLQVHPNNLSQVINSYENKNFYDFVNTLRIEEFKKLCLLPDNSRYTLLSIAFECGFNSKTSFNRNFRKTNGTSPSAWLKQADVQLTDE